MSVIKTDIFLTYLFISPLNVPSLVTEKSRTPPPSLPPPHTTAARRTPPPQIKARNVPCCDCGDLDGITAPQDVSLVGTPLVVVVEGDDGDGDWSEAAAVTPRRHSDSTGAERRPGGQSHHRGEDVLRCSSISAMRSKRNASFLEKNTPSSAVATNDSRGADYIPAQQRASLSSHHPMVRQVRRVVARDDDTGRLDEIAPGGGQCPSQSRTLDVNLGAGGRMWCGGGGGAASLTGGGRPFTRATVPPPRRAEETVLGQSQHHAIKRTREVCKTRVIFDQSINNILLYCNDRSHYCEQSHE